jgi:hypothetical protein
VGAGSAVEPPQRADDGIRTRDPHLGKVMRYQLRYVRVPPAIPATDANSNPPVPGEPNRYRARRPHGLKIKPYEKAARKAVRTEDQGVRA